MKNFKSVNKKLRIVHYPNINTKQTMDVKYIVIINNSDCQNKCVEVKTLEIISLIAHYQTFLDIYCIIKNYTNLFVIEMYNEETDTWEEYENNEVPGYSYNWKDIETMFDFNHDEDMSKFKTI